MTLTFLVLLTVLGAFFRARQRRCLGAGAMMLALALYFAVGCGPVPMGLLRALWSGEAARPVWSEKNLIVVLGVGTTRPTANAPADVPGFAFSRLVSALEVYRECKAAGKVCRMLVSGGDPQAHGATEAAVYSARLLGMGVPAEDVQLETASLNTWQNAQFTCAKAAVQDAGRVTVVTSGIHLRRAQRYFEHFCGPVQRVASDRYGAELSILPQSLNFVLTDAALHELLGMARYHVYNALGMNTR